jgi:DNA polymerase III delta subunit
VGPESWLKEETVRRLQKECLAPGFEEMDFVRFGEPPEDGTELLAVLRTPPFGSPFRLVVVEGFLTLNEASAPWLAPYAQNPNPKTRLVVCAQKAALPASVRGRFSLASCEPLRGEALKAWVMNQAKVLGKPIAPEGAELLTARLGGELQTLRSALEALALFAGEAQRIGRSEVERFILPSVRETAFDILDQAAAGEPGVALTALRMSLQEGKITVEQMMGALGWYYRNRAGRLSGAELQKALADVLEADRQLKLSHPAPELLFDQLLIRLAS